jgi:hypothetical protein
VITPGHKTVIEVSRRGVSPKDVLTLLEMEVRFTIIVPVDLELHLGVIGSAIETNKVRCIKTN